MSDASVLFRDIAGDAAAKVADKVNPNQEALDQLDKPAPDNTWHEKPQISASGIKQQINQAIPTAKKEARDVANTASANADPHGSTDPNAVANRPADQVDAQGGATAGLNAAKEKISSRIPDEHKENAKETAKEYRARTNAYFKEKFPEGRRDQLIYRVKKMIVEIQGHEDCKCCIIIHQISLTYSRHFSHRNSPPPC